MKNIASFLLVLCIAGFTLGASAETAAAQDGTHEEMTYFESKSFDKKLNKTLKKEPDTLTLTFPVSFTTNEIPERLDKWLYQVEEQKGTLKLVPVQAQRGLISDALSLVKNTYTSFKDKKTYSPVKKYDATLYYEAETGTITRLLFTRKNRAQ